jgi:hypothetical protein
MFPPGRARLAACPMPTGSAWFENTIGIVLVACRAGSTKVEEFAKNIHADQFGGEFRQLVDPCRPSALNGDVLALDVAQGAQARSQCLHSNRVSRSGAETQIPDPRHLRRLLGAGDERPSGCRASEKRDELAPP